MADLASLKIAVDSRDTRKATTDLDGLSTAATKTTTSVDRLAQSNARLATAVATSNKPIIDATRYINNMERELAMVGKSALQIKAIEVRMAAAAAPTAALAAEMRRVGAELIIAERNAQRAGGAMGQLTGVAGMQRQGFQQLGYQIGDISTMYSLGARPSQIFASQIGQITQAVQLAAGGTSKFAAFLGGPWGIALTVAVMALGPLLGKLFETDAAAEDTTRTLNLLEDQIDYTAIAADKLTEANMALAQSNREVEQTALQSIAAMRRTVEINIANQTAELASNVARLQRLSADTQIGPMSPEEAQAYSREMRRTRNEIVSQTTALTELQKASNTAAFDATRLTASMSAQDAQVESLTSTINDLREVYRTTGSTDAMAQMITLQQQLNDLENDSTGAAATRERTKAITDEQRERERQTESTKNFIDALKEETIRIGMSNSQLRQHEVELQMVAARTDAEREAIDRANQAREEAITNEARLQAQRESDQSIANSVKELDRLNAALFEEQMLRGLPTAERELTAIDLEQEALMASLTTEQMLLLGHSWLAYFEAKRAAARQEGGLEDDRKEAERLNKQLEDMGGLLDDIFGTKGKIGGFLNTLKDSFPALFNTIKQGLDSVLQSLTSSMAEVSQGAQAGAAVASMAKAAGLPSSQMGGQIGGAAGAAIGSAIPGVGPVIGSLVGGFLGSTLGGMIKGVKKASATIEIMSSNEVRSTVTGNESLKKVATGMADSLIKGLQDIADALGGELLAGMKISIGQRGSSFRVDPLGLGRTKGMIKFETEEEAIAYAMKLALEKGVITGIRESTQRLLAAGNDLQAAIEKSVLFESVFDRLLEKTDPLAYSMQKLDEEFAKLKVIFDEAGASLEEYAALQQLYAIEQQAIVTATAQAALDAQRRINDLMIRLYDASGDSAASLALARQMELAAATDAEKAILQQIYAIEDYTAARDKEVDSLQKTIDTMQAFSDSLKDFRESLFKADAGVASYRTALLDLMRVGGLASTGDATALGQLQGVSETFLTASMARAGSLFEYQKDVALVASYVDQGIAAAGEQIDAAQQQIDLLDAQLEQLINLNSGLDTLNQTLGGGAQTSSSLPVFDANQTGSSVIAGASSDTTAQLTGIMADGLYAIAKNTGATYNLLDRWDGDGQPDIRELSSDYY